MVIKWFPYEISVITTKMPKDEFGQFFFFPSPRILISEELEGSIYSSTLLHEILEMVNELHALGLTESKIRTLEVALSQVFGQTPGLAGKVFPEGALECPESDPGDEDDSRPVQTQGIDPRAS
jgi:hypothetical protein